MGFDGFGADSVLELAPIVAILVLWGFGRNASAVARGAKNRRGFFRRGDATVFEFARIFGFRVIVGRFCVLWSDWRLLCWFRFGWFGKKFCYCFFVSCNVVGFEGLLYVLKFYRLC